MHKTGHARLVESSVCENEVTLGGSTAVMSMPNAAFDASTMERITSTRIHRPTVLMAGQRVLVQSTMGWLLTNSRLDVVGQSSTSDDVLLHVKHLPPDVLLIDIDLPNLPISTVIRQVRYISPRTRIVVLADETDRTHHRLRRSPCDGLVSWSSRPENLINELHSTNRCWSPDHGSGDQRASRSPLSGRQVQVLELVSDGLSNREISAFLGIREGTVKRHLANIFDRLNAHSRIEAINKSLASGLLSPLEAG